MMTYLFHTYFVPVSIVIGEVLIYLKFTAYERTSPRYVGYGTGVKKKTSSDLVKGLFPPFLL